VSKRRYGQYCGFARALELVGERWAMMIVRDLLIGPKRFTDLQRGLPGIPTNILTSRLNELEDNGVVCRRVLPRPAKGIGYELTPAGRSLDEAVVALGRWGARYMGEPRPGETITTDSVAMALRSTFRPEAAKKANLTYVLRLGEVEVHARVRNGGVTVGRGPAPKPDLIIEAGPAIRMLLAQEISPAQALEKRLVRITGDPELFDRFARMFRIT
jgi:DNA-binding HxlR family transcriptional regulator